MTTFTRTDSVCQKIALVLGSIFAALLLALIVECGISCLHTSDGLCTLIADTAYAWAGSIVVLCVFAVLIIPMLWVAQKIDDRRVAQQSREAAAAEQAEREQAWTDFWQSRRAHIEAEQRRETSHAGICFDPFLVPVTPVFQESIDIQVAEAEMAAFADGSAHMPMIIVEAYAPREPRGQLDEYGYLPIKRTDDDAFLATLAAEYAGMDTGTYWNSGVPSWEWQD